MKHDSLIDCLTSGQLAQILDSVNDITDAMRAHIETCVECQHHLESMIDSDYLSSWSRVANSERFQKLYFGPAIGESLPSESFGHFQLESLIGSGGMGSVYRARDKRLGRIVAVKVLKHFENAESKVRFDREAQSLSRLDHPHLVPVFSADRTEDGRPYLVMPYIAGKTLRDVLQIELLEPKRAAEIILQISQGLHAAHGIGMIHRDVKPSNIIIENQNGLAKLVDFGLARMFDGETLTDSQVICGTPEYMSPEQIGNSHSVDPRSDQYSLGITLYECLTGTTPFRGKPLDVSKHDADALREISSELSDAADFALTYQMELRAAELTHLGRMVIEQLFETVLDRSADDLLLAAKALNLYAKSRLMLVELGAGDSVMVKSVNEACLLAQDCASQAFHQFQVSKQYDSTELASLEVFRARHNQILARDNNLKGEATSQTADLERLADEIRVAYKSEAMAISWAKLHEGLLYDLALLASPPASIDYLNSRSEQLKAMQRFQTEGSGKVDSWTIRSIAKNDALIGRQFAQLGDAVNAREKYATAAVQFQGLCELYALSGYYRISWFESLFLIANLDWEEGQRDSAMDYYQRALMQIELLSQLNPQDENVARRAAELHQEVGKRYLENSQPDLAARMFREGAGCAERAARNPYRMDRDPTFYNELAQQLMQLAVDAERDFAH
jgi:serine/threonine protein kinase